MTGYTVHTGTSKKFVSGWDRIFSDTNKEDSSKQGKNAGSKASKTKPAVKGSGGKAAAKKSAGKAGKKKVAGKKKST